MMKQKHLLQGKKSNGVGYFFILGMDVEDDKFLLGVYKNDAIKLVGRFSEGMTETEKMSLKETIKKNSNKHDGQRLYIEPNLCVKVKFAQLNNDEIINPQFLSFEFRMDAQTCTWNRLVLDNLDVDITSRDKPIWNEPLLNKEDYLIYLYYISPYMLPFLRQRALTVKRYPHGVSGEYFYQKNAPDYSPNFIKTKMIDEINYIVCNDLKSLLWLGNQLAIEFHIPYETIDRTKPVEIVFDLDPPNRDYFPLAIKAALEMKKIFEQFSIKSFPKLSGNKGIQIHIPIHKLDLSYDETKLFTSFIANYLVEHFPKDFTIERLKKHRGKKLYIDYVQFAEGKTIICPYSARGTEEGTVAAPLFWDEINSQLQIETYTIPHVLTRMANIDCPLRNFFTEENLAVKRVIDSLKENDWKAL